LDHEPALFKWTAGESNPDFLGANQASSRWTSSPRSFSSRGESRTHKITSFSNSPLFPFAYPAVRRRRSGCAKWQVRVSHPAVRAYEAQLSTGSPASKFSDQGESRTPTPFYVGTTF
jgi:hypothetical protein